MGYFGTDGIRGRFGADPISPAFALKVGLAAGQVLGAGQTVVMGRDTRASGPVLKAALEAGLLASGLNVVRLGVLPTPGIAHLGRALGAVASIVVSASHNPHDDNGIKFFNGDGAQTAGCPAKPDQRCAGR
jgi:phosphoglucosamine mutase